jgi:hypothetical protein
MNLLTTREDDRLGNDWSITKLLKAIPDGLFTI